PQSGDAAASAQSGTSSSSTGSTAPSTSSSASSGTSGQGSTGAQSGDVNSQSTASGSSLPQSSAASDTATLQGQIQQALQNETTLSNDKVTANVTDTEIELTGTVATGKDKQTAKRTAQSYAGNRKVVEHIKV